MEEMLLGPLATSFAALRDPRVDRMKDYQLLDFVLIAVCAVVCAAALAAGLWLAISHWPTAGDRIRSERMP